MLHMCYLFICTGTHTGYSYSHTAYVLVLYIYITCTGIFEKGGVPNRASKKNLPVSRAKDGSGMSLCLREPIRWAPPRLQPPEQSGAEADESTSSESLTASTWTCHRCRYQNYGAIRCALCGSPQKQPAAGPHARSSPSAVKRRNERLHFSPDASPRGEPSDAATAIPPLEAAPVTAAPEPLKASHAADTPAEGPRTEQGSKKRKLNPGALVSQKSSPLVPTTSAPSQSANDLPQRPFAPIPLAPTHKAIPRAPTPKATPRAPTATQPPIRPTVKYPLWAPLTTTVGSLHTTANRLSPLSPLPLPPSARPASEPPQPPTPKRALPPTPPPQRSAPVGAQQLVLDQAMMPPPPMPTPLTPVFQNQIIDQSNHLTPTSPNHQQRGPNHHQRDSAAPAAAPATPLERAVADLTPPDLTPPQLEPAAVEQRPPRTPSSPSGASLRGSPPKFRKGPLLQPTLPTLPSEDGSLKHPRHQLAERRGAEPAQDQAPEPATRPAPDLASEPASRPAPDLASRPAPNRALVPVIKPEGEAKRQSALSRRRVHWPSDAALCDVRFYEPEEPEVDELYEAWVVQFRRSRRLRKRGGGSMDESELLCDEALEEHGGAELEMGTAISPKGVAKSYRERLQMKQARIRSPPPPAPKKASRGAMLVGLKTG